jgi:hypothetical protein
VIYVQCPRGDIQIIVGDLNAKIGREDACRTVIGK